LVKKRGLASQWKKFYICENLPKKFDIFCKNVGNFFDTLIPDIVVLLPQR
jgi:hypothetical protein